MIALFGGTFDPPHLGHLNTVVHAAEQCGIKRVGLMPCKLSPLKASTAINDEHRLAILNLLCESTTNKQIQLYVEDIELTLPSPSYTVNTLKHLRSQIPADTPLCFFLGEDSLYSLDQWRSWHSLLNYCHMIVLPRDGAFTRDNEQVTTWLSANETDTPELLMKKPSSYVYRCNTPLTTISSTELRTAIRCGDPATSQWLPPTVLRYITQHSLYLTSS